MKSQIPNYKSQTILNNQASIYSLTLPLSPQRLCRNVKIHLFGKGERQSGGKVLERQPLTVWIRGSYSSENIRFCASESSPYLENPHSKTLESDCLSPQTFHHNTIFQGRGRG